MQEQTYQSHWNRMRMWWFVVFMLVTLKAEAMLSPLDFLALQSLKRSLRDMPGSTYMASWDFSKDPCEFPGVLCSSEDPQRVLALNLGDPGTGSPGLTGKISGAIGLLTSLVELTIVPGQVFGNIPLLLCDIRELKFLALSRNYLTGRIPYGFSFLNKLETLDLSFNLLEGSIPHGLGQLPLTNVILCNNRFTGKIPDFSSASGLVRIDISHNSLSGPLPLLPPSLEYFSASYNQIRGGLHNLRGLNNLNYVDLSLNKLGGNIPTSLLEVPSLESLFLQRNSFTGSIYVSKDVAMVTLDLSYNVLSGHISSFLANVQSLYLNNNHFSGSVPSQIVSRLLSGSMKLLYVQHNYLTNLHIRSGTGLPLSSSLCAQFNCLDPPPQSHCPLRVGNVKRRPIYQCRGKRKRH